MNDLNAVIIAGSQHTDAQSLKVAKEIRARLTADERYNTPQLFDLAATPLPFLGAEASASEAATVGSLGDALIAADALVVVTPEWHGMATAAVKNFFLHYSRGQLAHKPALLVSVSAGVGGSYPIAELRSSSYKNSRVCYLPEHMIVRDVKSIFNADGDNDPDAQSYMSARLDYCLAMLATYADSFRTIRDGLPDGSEYPNGM